LNISGCILGGRVNGDGSSINNIVNVYGNITMQGWADAITGGEVAHFHGVANNNSVNIFGNIHFKGGSFISGGQTYYNGSANSNSVNISGNIESKQGLKIVGGFIGHGDDSGNGNSNSVTISGTIESEGHIQITGATGYNNKDNTVNISGRIVSRYATITGGEGYKNVLNNKVIISETAEIPNNCSLYGGESISVREDSLGNSLEISFSKSLRVRTIGSFQEYKFTLLEGISAGETILSFADCGMRSRSANACGHSATGSDDESRAADACGHSTAGSDDERVSADADDVMEGVPFNIDGIKITTLLSPRSDLNSGDSVVLMHCDSGITGSVSSETLVGVYKGLVLERRSEFNLALSESNEELIATLISTSELSPQEVNVKSYSEGVCAALAFANQGGDIVSGEAMEEAGNILGGGVEAFGALRYGSSKYTRGSNVEVKGIGAVAGVGKRVERKGEKGVIYGVFCEYGDGEYKARNRFRSGEVEGKGGTEYIGLGVLGKIEYGERLEGKRGEGLYVEGSVRVGVSKVDYKTSDIEVEGELERKEVKYDYNTQYVGVTVGCGYGYKVSEAIKVEGYGKYKGTWQGGKEIELRSKERITFDGAMSNRIRIGAKVEYEGKSGVKPYIGLGGEEEIGGEIRAKAEGKAIEGVKLEGLTGIGEVGVSVDISEKVKMEVRGECCVGKREGLLGMVKVKYAI
jgi:hypothetical protein